MAQTKKSPKTAAKARKAPASKAAQKRRAQATTRVYAKKFREDPKAAFEAMMNCLSKGELDRLKKNLQAQYQHLQEALAQKQASFVEKQASLLHPLRAFQSLFASEKS